MPFMKERGDTLIEVLLSLGVLAAITVGALGVMNRGIALNLNVLERTEARAKLTEQTELLTYFRDQYMQAVSKGQATTVYPANVWPAIVTRGTGNSAGSIAPTTCTTNSKSFYLGYESSQYQLKNYAAATDIRATLTPLGGDGLWVDAVTNTSSAVPYVDLYVKACWSGSSSSQGERLSTTARLYYD